MDKPKGKDCEKCGETIYGLSEKDLDYKMEMHLLKHRRQEAKNIPIKKQEVKNGRRRR